MTAPKRLPFEAPYRMRAIDAARFVGDSVNLFHARVKSGDYPPPRWRERRSVYWSTVELIEAMESRGVEGEPIEDPTERAAWDKALGGGRAA